MPVREILWMLRNSGLLMASKTKSASAASLAARSVVPDSSYSMAEIRGAAPPVAMLENGVLLLSFSKATFSKILPTCNI